MAVETRQLDSDSLPREVVFHLGADRLVRVARTDSGWVSREERLPWTNDTLVVDGTIRSTLYEALDRAATDLARRDRAELAWALADIFEYRVDMSRDLQDGDRIKVLVQRSTAPNGATKLGPILAASLTVSGSTVEAIRHVIDGRERYYDQDGKTLQAAFLRAPVAFRRISSVFGMRLHPILGIMRAHKGTDYAAASGTPVRSVGDGVVIFAGQKSGFGNVLEVRHRNGFVSRYGHLRGFAKSIRRGTRVSIGQTIAFVGMTGLATAPHLHFEVLVNGRQRNPRVALAMKGGEPLDRRELAAFEDRRSMLLAAMDRIESRRSLTSRGVGSE
jgi:murein DD-endopeptidase MepM/ murein hydrolase activator NlpD